MAVDMDTASRLRDEFELVRNAVQGSGVDQIEDPIGSDGIVSVMMSSFRATGAGEVLLEKINERGDRRYTHFRTWGPTGLDYVEKASYLIKANGATQFSKKRAEPGDQIVAAYQPDESDQAWISDIA